MAAKKSKQGASITAKRGSTSSKEGCASTQKGKQDVQSDADPQGDSSHNIELGRQGEMAAVRFLEKRGLEIWERNWKCRFGEADIIAADGDTLVFIEVKTRSNIDHGFPEEAITPSKRSRYEKIAALYTSENVYGEMPVRFDVIGILVTGKSSAMLRYHVNAFGEGF